MEFTTTWFNSTKNIYDSYFIPEEYTKLTKVRLTNKLNYSDYLDTKLSLAQLHNYSKGCNLIDSIFDNLTKEELEWIKKLNSNSNYLKYKTIVNKVEIR